jgi:hypothetical protein
LGGKSSQSTQSVAIPQQVLAAYQSVNANANQVAQTPFQTYGSAGATNTDGSSQELVAPVNAQQQSGIAGTNAAATEAQPYYDAATGTLGQTQNNTTGVNNAATGLAAASAGAVNPTALDANSIQQYLSPYLGDVLGTTNALANQNNNIAQSGELGNAITSGAFGGDRTGIAAANLNQQNSLAEQATDAGILNQGYNTALSTAQQQQGVGLAAGQANRAALGSAATNLAGIGQTAYGEGANTASELGALGTGAENAALTGAQAQIGAGTVEQQTQQAADTAEYNQFLQQQSYPFQTAQFLANIAEGTGALSGSTTTTTQPGGFFSDRRLKHDIKKIGKTYDGQAIYSYKMHGDSRTHIGLMAQDVEKKHPESVGLAAGYKIVDYGAATKDAANRGHFAEGGLVPRKMYAVGGGPSIVSPADYSAILAAQSGMYAPRAGSSGVYGGESGGVPRGGSSRVPPPSGATPHLVTAEGGLRPRPTAVQNLSDSLKLARAGEDMYKDNRPHTTTTTTPGGLAAGTPVPQGDWSLPGADTDGSADDQRRSGGRIGKDEGGGIDDVLAAQSAMYQPKDKGQRDIPSGGGGGHTLTVASGTPAPPPSGSSNVNSAVGLVNDGQKVYKAFNKPSATGTDGGGTPVPQGEWSQAGANIDGSAMAEPVSAPASSTGLAAGSADAAAGDAAAGAAGDVAAGAATDAAAGAAGDAAAEAAAAIAAEYAAADVGAVALAAAKRGGRIRRAGGGLARGGYDAGGMPYSDAGGSLDIPDESGGGEKVQTAGPIVKQPTGLQTLIKMGDPNGAGTMVGDMFSNQGFARGGLAGRRGYDDGGDVADPDMDEPVSEAPSGLAAGSGEKPWYKKSSNLIPLAQALAAMGTAPTKHLGVALAAGLGAGASAYQPQQQAEEQQAKTHAETTGLNINNKMSQQALDMMNKYGNAPPPASVTVPQTAVSNAPPPANTTDIPGYYADRYMRNLNMTPQEQQRISALKAVDAKMHTNLAAGAQLEYDQRKANSVFDIQSSSQRDYDKFNTVVRAPDAGDSSYTNLKQINPELAGQVARKAKLDPMNQDTWSAQDKANADKIAAQMAAAHMAAIHQYTGSEYKTEAGTQYDQRSNAVPTGIAAQQLSPEQKSGRQIALAQPVTYGANLPAPLGQAAGINQGPPAPARAPVAPAAAPPMRPTAPQTQTLNGVDMTQFPPMPKAAPVTDQISKANAEKRGAKNIDVQEEGVAPYREQASAAARNSSIYAQLENTLDKANPREFGPSSKSYKALADFKTYLSGLPPDGLVNLAEADKYLTQLGVGGSKQLLGADQQLRQQEMLTLMSHANPNIDQPLQAIKNLAAYGRAGNEFDLKAANTAIDAIRNHNADPAAVPGVIQAQAPRDKYVMGRLSTPKAAFDYLRDHPDTAQQFKKRYGYLP